MFRKYTMNQELSEYERKKISSEHFDRETSKRTWKTRRARTFSLEVVDNFWDTSMSCYWVYPDWNSVSINLPTIGYNAASGNFSALFNSKITSYQEHFGNSTFKLSRNYALIYHLVQLHIPSLLVCNLKNSINFLILKNILPCLQDFLASYTNKEGTRKKKRQRIYVQMEKKTPFVRLQHTPSAFGLVVLIQLD